MGGRRSVLSLLIQSLALKYFDFDGKRFMTLGIPCGSLMRL